MIFKKNNNDMNRGSNMIKRWLFIFTICIGLTGCGSQSNNTTVTEGDENVTYSSDSGTDYFFDSLPFVMNYNESNINYIDVDFYQDETEHGYSIYAIAAFNIRNLSDDDLYWMDKNKDLDVLIYITNEKNSLDFEGMRKLCTFDKDGIRSVVFWLSGEYRYDFADSELNTFANIGQDDTYEFTNDDRKTSELNKRNSYQYSLNIVDENDIKSSNEINDELFNAMMRGFDDIKDAYNNLLD